MIRPLAKLRDRPRSPPSQAVIPSVLNGLPQHLDEALITLGPMRGGLQEATTAELELNAIGES